MSRIVLKNVRIAWPHLFEKNTYQGVETSYDAQILIKKDDKENLKKIKSRFSDLQSEANVKVKNNMLCLKDGDDDDKEDYHGHYILKTSSKNDQPHVMHSDKSSATKNDNPIYSGCLVNVSLDFWLQNNQYGKRINSNLYAVMFAGDADPIGNTKPTKDAIESDFEDIQATKRKEADLDDEDEFDLDNLDD